MSEHFPTPPPEPLPEDIPSLSVRQEGDSPEIIAPVKQTAEEQELPAWWRRAEAFGEGLQELALKAHIDPTVAQFIGAAPRFILWHAGRKLHEIHYSITHPYPPTDTSK